jgi:hypothetical protein
VGGGFYMKTRRTLPNAYTKATAHSSGFKAPFTLSEGLHRTLHYEFIDPEKDEVVFVSE